MNYVKIDPYTDEDLEWNDKLGMYIITEQAIIKKGIDIRGRLNKLNAVSPEYIINAIRETISYQIYGYIHDCSVDNTLQDYIIATCASVRPILQTAMQQQAIYYLEKGNLSRSVDRELRAIAIDHNAKQTLNITIKDFGVPITYIGVC